MIRVDTLFRAVSRDAHARAVGARNGHQWCHLWCDPGEEGELHTVAGYIGLKLAWFQNKPGFPHYDLTPLKRIDVLHRRLAVETDLVRWLRERKQREELIG